MLGVSCDFVTDSVAGTEDLRLGRAICCILHFSRADTAELLDCLLLLELPLAWVAGGSITIWGASLSTWLDKSKRKSGGVTS